MSYTMFHDVNNEVTFQVFILFLINSVLSYSLFFMKFIYMDKLHELKALKFTFCFPFFFFFISNLSAVKEGELTDSISTKSKDNDSLPSVSLVRKQFGGRYAISSEEFTSEMVRLVKLTVHLCMRRIFFPYIALMEVDFNFLRLELNPEISHI